MTKELIAAQVARENAIVAQAHQELGLNPKRALNADQQVALDTRIASLDANWGGAFVAERNAETAALLADDGFQLAAQTPEQAEAAIAASLPANTETVVPAEPCAPATVQGAIASLALSETAKAALVTFLGSYKKPVLLRTGLSKVDAAARGEIREAAKQAGWTL